MKAPLPPNERGRLEALRRYDVLDTEPEQAFEDLIFLAAQICLTPTAMVSLIDENRQWFKSRLGLVQSETPRDVAFCAHTILRPEEVMEIRDTKADLRFADNPLVTGDPGYRFYAGASLISPEGHALGALCVMDFQPRQLTSAQLAALQALSRRAVAQLELSRQAGVLKAKEQEANRLLIVAEKSRRALLSLLEDEKRGVSSLRESETRFRQVVENIHEVFWMRDLEKGQVIFVSPAFERIWGRPCAELLASRQCWLDSIFPEDRERVQVADAKKVLGTYREEYRILRPDGTMRWIFDQAFPVRNAGGQVYRVVGVAEDITERKNLEGQFLRAQRMEAIGTLAGGVAHDLNNILAPILMATGFLKGKFTDPVDREMLGMVETSTQRGAAVIRQLLTFSRGFEGTRVSVQLRHLITDMIHIARETFPRNIMIEQMVRNDLWTVQADATQMHQVLLNLCVNARDALPEGGRLSVHAENLMVSARPGGSLPMGEPKPHVRLMVTDTGIGIPPGVIERIFDPFFTTKEIGKGTGLGLSTVMGIVKSHGGWVTVESEPGQGTAFSVFLPATDLPAAAGLTVRPHEIARGQGELILVVDDEESILTAVCHILQENNYGVLLARNGREATTLFRANVNRVRLVLTDIMMPVMGGVELCRVLREIRPGIEIIATTGLHQELDTAELVAMGVTEMLLKPYEPPDLLAAVRRLLEAKPVD